MGSLSGVTSVLTPLLQFSGLPGAAATIGSKLIQEQEARATLRQQQDQALAQLQARQGQEEEASVQSAALQKQQLAAEAAADQARRMSALRRAVARQKTLFSAQGIGGVDSGSNEAVLLGLYNEDAIDGDERKQMDRLKTTALDQSLTQQRQKNLLESAQLADRYNLDRVIRGY